MIAIEVKKNIVLHFSTGILSVFNYIAIDTSFNVPVAIFSI